MLYNDSRTGIATTNRNRKRTNIAESSKIKEAVENRRRAISEERWYIDLHVLFSFFVLKLDKAFKNIPEKIQSLLEH